MESATAAAAIASLVPLIASVPGDCTAAVAKVLSDDSVKPSRCSTRALPHAPLLVCHAIIEGHSCVELLARVQPCHGPMALYLLLCEVAQRDVMLCVCKCATSIGISAVLRSCSPEALASQRALCASLRQLVKAVWEHVDEKRSSVEVAEAYQVPMSRVHAACFARLEYQAVLEQMDHVLGCLDQLLEQDGKR